ncbi:MAG: hypothetical protein K2X87_08395 [Gemmataceae bacterium]|nr:hypothetical protein [Gemmataceae bacterium]
MSRAFDRDGPLELPPSVAGWDWAAGYRAFDEAGEGAAPPMLEFRRKTGSSLALGYAWLARAEYDPAAGITLRYPDGYVTRLGRNLYPVYAAILRHRARWVWEADRPSTALAGDGEPVVEAILTGVVPAGG